MSSISSQVLALVQCDGGLDDTVIDNRRSGDRRLALSLLFTSQDGDGPLVFYLQLSELEPVVPVWDVLTVDAGTSTRLPPILVPVGARFGVLGAVATATVYASGLVISGSL